jgi:hypothetical protein
MRDLLRRVGFRYGVSVGVLVVVALVVIIARAAGHPATSLVTSGAPNVPVASGSPDDGSATVPSPVAPLTSPGAATPQQVATAFTRAWLHHTGVTAKTWLASLTPYVTDRLAGQLTSADPETVPASRITGPVALTPHAADWVEVAVPVDGGALDLSLRATGGHWAVDTIDWSPTP